ncbi:MAG: DNA polymerase-4 [Candidatus Saccharimonadales bacterium]|jgi:DNA polymerase-4
MKQENLDKNNLQSPIFNPQSMVNKGLPYVMHIDLNSCFAIIEQQANRLLRGRPVGVPAYDTPRGMIIAASYEAKAKGIKLGVNVEQARSMAPGIVIMTPDPAKYREAHRLFKEVLLEYSPDVTPKSIDEFVLDLSASLAHNPTVQGPTLYSNGVEGRRLRHNEAMKKIGLEIKSKIRERLGEWVTVNIGIAPNRFLAKYAAGFGKPDGMTLIDHVNLRSKYEGMALVDLPGINTRFRARLREAGVYTPIEFLEADLTTLKKRVFKSINGYHWYMRLRGYEADAIEFSQKSIGHQYALPHKTTDLDELSQLLMKLCEKAGRRLRKTKQYASGIHLYLGFTSEPSHNNQLAIANELPNYNDPINHRTSGTQKIMNSGFRATSTAASPISNPHTSVSPDAPASFEHMYKMRSWHRGEKVYHRMYSTQDIYQAAKRLLYTAEIPARVRILAVNVYGLAPLEPYQTSLFDQNGDWGLKIGDSPYRAYETGKRISDAVDTINNRYGEFVVTPALMMEMQGKILDRIAFGQVQDI